jgi:antitoxin CptB
MSHDPEHEARLRRIRYRAWHRGFREADLILGPFADRHLDRLDGDQLDRLERLLDQPDQDLYDWIVGRQPTPAAFDDDVMGLIRSFRFFAHSARAAGQGA